LDGFAFNGDSSSIKCATGSLGVGNHTWVYDDRRLWQRFAECALTVQESTLTTDPATRQFVREQQQTSRQRRAAPSVPLRLDFGWFNRLMVTVRVSTCRRVRSGLVHTLCGNDYRRLRQRVTKRDANRAAATATSDPADQAVCQGATANFSTTA